MKGKSKSFIFILGISIITLIVLVLGSVIFSKDSSLVFSGDGYIINSNSEKLYFKSGTTYKENLEKEYAFVDDSKKDVSVAKDSFIHYNDNSIGFMKNGAIMDLASANMSIVPYYNITNKSTITYNNGKYYISTVNGDLDFENILGRISDNKYIVAGKNMTLKLPEVLTAIEGDYFEITFIEDGIAKIDNQESSYQTATQGTYINIGDKIVIDLGSMKIVYDGESEMSLSQITIDGNENIDILPDDKAVKEGENVGGPIENPNENGNNITNNNDNNQTVDNTDNDNDDNKEDDNDNKKEDTSANIELVEASVTTNKIKASFKYNNLDKIDGNLVLSIVDISNGNKVYNKVLDKSKETDDITVESLSPNTNYLMTISNNSNNISTQYFSQAFRTEELGIVLSKVYATSNSLTYNIDYLENSNVNSVTLGLYDKDMKQVGTSLISTKSDNNELTFSNIDSNTSYTVKVDNIVMNNMNYVNVYNLDRTDITLKKIPDTSTMEMEAVGKKNTAFLGVSKIKDDDSSIISYTYKIYDSNYRGDTDNKVLYSKKVDVNKNDTGTSSLRLDIKDLPAEYRNLGYYRFSIDITYYDNEKTMVIKNGQISSEFFMTLDDEEPEEDDNRIILDFKQDFENSTYNTIAGKIKITDKGHKILVKGRDNYNEDTKFVLTYYSGDISTLKTISLDVTSDDIDDKGNIVKDINISGLVNNSGYVFTLYSDIREEGKIISGQIVDRSFNGTTKADVDKLKFNVVNVNLSNDTNVINFDGNIVATNPESNDSLAYLTATLYKGSTVEVGNKIGETITINGSEIFNNTYNFTNNSFGITDVLDLTLKSGDTLYQNYTVVLSEAYYESGNLVEIENNVYTYSISIAYMLERQLDEPTIAVEDIKNNGTDDKLDDSTVIGYEVTVGASIEKLKSLLGDLGIESINYYIYKLDSDDNETLIKTINAGSDVFTQELYFKGINEYNRGGRYVFKYDISIAGLTEKYPTVPVASEVFKPEKQNPLFTMYKSYTNSDSAVYKYKFVDVDNAMYKDGDIYKFYYQFKDSDDFLEKELTIDSKYQELVIDNLNINDEFSIHFDKRTIDDEEQTRVKILDDKFEGLQKLNEKNNDSQEEVSKVKYDLRYTPNDNRLGIHISDDNNGFLNRIILYEVTISSNGIDDYVKIFNRNDLSVCPSTGESNCIVIDYNDLKRFKSKDSIVKVKVYYDNGLSGIDLYSTDKDLLGIELNNGYVFADKDNNYLSLDKDNQFVKGNSNSIYNYNIEDNNINIIDYLDESVENSLVVDYLSNAISFKEQGEYYPKGISLDSMKTDDESFRFDSIIPKVTPITGTNVNTISKINIGVDFDGLTVENLTKEFEKEDDQYYVYVKLSDDTEVNDEDREKRISITLEGEGDNKKIKIGNAIFDNLLPDTKYYYKLYAKLKQKDGNYQKVELFDASDANSYINSLYETSTLSAKDIYDNDHPNQGFIFNAKYKSTYSERKFSFQYTAASYRDYTLKVQLLDSENNDYFDEHRNVTFNDNTGADIHNLILENKNSKIIYGILDDDFVYGDNYYTIVLTAISNNDSKSELKLYESKLKSKSNGIFTVDVSPLKLGDKNENVFSILANSSTETENGMLKSSIDASIGVTDDDKVILYNLKDNNSENVDIDIFNKSERGKYSVRLRDANDNVVCVYNSNCVKNSGSYVCDCSKEDADKNPEDLVVTFGRDNKNIANNVIFTNLTSSTDTYYYVETQTYIYRNNYINNVKINPNLELYTARQIIYTSSTNDVSLGSNVSLSALANSITLSYSGFSNLDKITKIHYVLKPKQSTTSLYPEGDIYATNEKPLFNFYGAEATFTVDLLVNKQKYTLINGKPYSFTVQYFSQDEEGKEKKLFDNDQVFDFTFKK